MGVTIDMTALFAWLEAASLLAVLITLIYLARQVRQENLLLRSEALVVAFPFTFLLTIIMSMHITLASPST